MTCFPFYMNIENAPCVIVGGGKTALRKIEVLRVFKPKITVIAPEICDEIRAFSDVEIAERQFADPDLNGAMFVISATDNRALNRHIFELCSSRRIPVNCVDDPQNCTFIFPAIVTNKSVTAAVSTGGKSPTGASFLKKLIEDALDDTAINSVEILGKYRGKIHSAFSSQDARKEAFEALLDLCLITDAKVREDDVENLIMAVKAHED